MRKFLLMSLVIFSMVQSVWTQNKKKSDLRNAADKFVILSCTPNLSETKILNGKAIKLVKPAYPKEVLKETEKSVVNVQIIINRHGKVISASAVSGYIGFQKAAEKAAKESIFKQFIRCGKPVEVNGILFYDFIPSQ